MNSGEVEALRNGLYSIPILIGSFLSIVAAGIVIGTYRQFEELRRHPNGLVLWKCAFDVLFAVTTLVEGSLRLSDNGATVNCRAVAFFIEFALIGSELCFFMLSFDLFAALRNPFVDYKASLRLYRFFMLFFPAILASTLVGVGPTALYGLTNFGVCWVNQTSGQLMWGFFYTYIILIYIWSAFVLLYARHRLAKGLRDTYEARMTSFRHGAMFASGYLAFWLCVAIVYWVSLRVDTAPDVSPAAWIFTLIFTCRAVPTAVVWVLSHDLREIARSEAATRFRYGGTLGRVNQQLQPHLNLALRKEVLHYTTLAIRMSVMHAVGMGPIMDAITGMRAHVEEERRRFETPQEALPHHPALQQGARKTLSSFRRMSSALLFGGGHRRTPSGGSTGAPDAAAAPAARRNPLQARGLLPEPHDDLPAFAALSTPYRDQRPDSHLDAGWKPLEISLYAHMFERGGALDVRELLASEQQSSSQGGQQAPPTQARGREFSPAQQQQRRADTTAVTETPTSAYDGVIRRPPLELQDLAPDIFARVRHLFGISPAQFLLSLSRTTKETFSEGASGAFMCFSHDMRFVIKTMEGDEAAALRRMLPAYLHHVRTNRDTLIIRFFACMSLKLYRHTLFFVVMENVFPTKATIHERFDLKGSWVGRAASKGTPGTVMRCRYCGTSFKVGASSQSCPARPNRSHFANTVLKDNDLNFKLRLPAENAAKLRGQLKADVAFLAQQGVMDYSLLAGVHNRKFRVETETHAAESRGGGSDSSPATSLPPTTWVSAAALTASAPQPLPGLRPPRLATRGLGAHVSVIEEEEESEDAWSESGGSTPRRFAAPRSATAAGAVGLNSSLQSQLQGSRWGLSPSAASQPSHFAAEGVQSSFGTANPMRALQQQQQLLQQRRAVVPPHQEGQYTPFFRSEEGGLAAAVVEGPGVFFLGIIDILQEWSLAKRIERWLKSFLLCQDAAGISVMPPEQYAERFMRRVVGQFIDGGREGEAASAPAAAGLVSSYGVPQGPAFQQRAAPASQGLRPPPSWQGSTSGPTDGAAGLAVFSSARVSRTPVAGRR